MEINNIHFDCTIEEVIEKLQGELRRRNSPLLAKTSPSSGYLMVCCPYHKNGLERHPSAQFRDEDGLFYCHACKETHSLASVISYCLNENGWKWLIRNFLNNSSDSRKVKIDIDREEVKQENQFVDREELKKYNYIHKYILNRGISAEIVKKFNVGYDPSNECITFPNKDLNGNIAFLATRSINTKFFHYPKSTIKPVYGLYEIKREIEQGNQINSIYITESMIDALQIWTWGQYAIALNGLGSKDQLKTLIDFPCREYILATDNDERGKEARKRIKAYLEKYKIIKEISYKSYQDCKDINDMTEEQFTNADIIWEL